ncbi:hypothetical protein [Salicola sp. Rm-C-2C1-2]|uniref:hypothetical protein n=1 Tax=Salicola sp. Rm-C-2C1-2 TaxID=3141321 RepID=UPI0032E4BD90
MQLDKALVDPAAVFTTPDEVVTAEGLSTDQRIRILRRREYDALELTVADDENMPGDSTPLLEKVLAALHRLGYTPDPEQEPPTKQGGV